MIETLTILAAALSAYFAYVANRESRASRLASDRSAAAALEIARDQQSLYTHEVCLQFFSELRRWADESLDTLGELMALCYLDPTETSFHFKERRCFVINQLSALADRGRFFLPNDEDNQSGQHKADGFKGFRHPALDDLINAFRVGKRLSPDSMEGNQEAHRELEKCRRSFVGHIQNLIGTKEWLRLVEKQRPSENA